MSLRLRLAAFYSVLLAVVLAVAGMMLHVGLERSLLASLDAGLQDALALARPLVQEEDGKPTLTQEGELAPKLPAGLSLVLLDAHGRPLQSLGHNSGISPGAGPGCSSINGWRICRAPVPHGSLTALKSLESLQSSVASLDRVLFFLFPAMIPVAFGLGYALSGRALSPLVRMTHAAYALARRRAWQEQLPEPRSRDEVWRLARATNTLLGALAEVIESERRFTQHAAHELRTPLTVLRGRLERALETGRAGEVREALHAGDALLELVEKLLALARAESGQGLRPQRVVLDEVVTRVADELQVLFDAKGLALERRFPEGPVIVRGDPTALGIVVRNLLDNALKFTDRGKVLLELRAKHGDAILAVQDTGPGIPEQALPHVFDRFFRAGAGLRQPGTGLGLALVRALVSWHEGDVQAANAEGGGARFTVRLPLAGA